MSIGAFATRKKLIQRPPSPRDPSPTPSYSPSTSRTATLAQRAQANPRALRPADIQDLQRTIGNQAVARLLADPPDPLGAAPATIASGGPRVQMKLKVGAADDRFEREADRIAEQVAERVGAPSGTSQARPGRSSGTVQRALPAVGRQGGPLAAGLESRIRGARGGGRPVPHDVLRAAEPALGADLSGVRVHADRSAQQLSQQLGARAFTHGRDIFLGAGQSMHDRRLMAHELTHTVHQGAARPGPAKPRVPRSAIESAGAAPGVQRETDIGSMSEEEKRAYIAKTGKKRQRWLKAGRFLNYLNPLGLLDDITAIPFHIKDFFDFARTGKRRRARKPASPEIDMRRHGGLTGIRMYTAGVDYHRNAFTEGGETSDPREYKGFNPVRLMMRQAAKLGHKGKKAELSLGRGEQYRQERENAMKQQARQKPKDENFTVPKQLELGPLGLDDDDIN